MFLRAPLIKMRGFVLTNDWMVQTTTLCVNLVLRQRQLLRKRKMKRKFLFNEALLPCDLRK